MAICTRSCDFDAAVFSFNVRGVDETGSVANYAESEQIAVFPVGVACTSCVLHACVRSCCASLADCNLVMRVLPHLCRAAT